MMKRLFFVTDLDGTALGGGFTPYARFPDHFSKFLDTLAKNNCDWGINTTWDAGGQMDLVNLSSVESCPAYLMAEFGCRLAKPDNKEVEFVNPYTSRMEERIKEFYESHIRLLALDLCQHFTPERMFFYGHAFMFYLADGVDLQCFADHIKPYCNDPEMICSIKGKQFSVRPSFLVKGAALREANSILGVSPDQVVVAGDETTDLSMMDPTLATHYLCPSNAADAVKAHVLKHGGEVGELPYGAGIIQAFNALSKKKDWNFVT